MRQKAMYGLIVLAVAALLGLGAAGEAASLDRSEVLIVGAENDITTIDIHFGANRPAYGASWNLHARLLTFGTKKLSNGTLSYNYEDIQPELAESFTVSPDKHEITLVLRKGLKFHNGDPITVEDVKWTFDRAVSLGGFPTVQMAAGSMTKPEQFEIVDASTFKVRFPHVNRLSLPDLAVPVPAIYNSKLAKKHATAQDPWAKEWLKTNDAGAGPFMLEKWTPGEEIVYRAFEGYVGGAPRIKRVVFRIIPSAATRRALLERGDLDIAFELPPKDVAELARNPKLKVESAPIENIAYYVAMNTRLAPFDNKKLRQAVCYAVPYEKIVKEVLYGRGLPLNTPIASNTFGHDPKLSPYRYDLERAKKVLAEAGYPNGLDVEMTITSARSLDEQIAVWTQAELKKIGVNVKIKKIPDGTFVKAMVDKTMAFQVNNFGGWLNDPAYFFFWNFHGGHNANWNTGNYANPALDAVIEKARLEPDRAKYLTLTKDMQKVMLEDAPWCIIFQPYLDVVMQPNVKGFVYWFHRQIDFRPLYKEKGS